MCNQYGGQWTGSRCEFEEGHHSTTAYPGHHSSTAYPGHHMTGPPPGWPDNKEDCENMEGGFWQEDRHRCESESMCNLLGGRWDANRCEFHHSTTAYPGHHSSTAYPGH